MMQSLQQPETTPVDRDRYLWQLGVAGFGEEGQRRLQSATALVSRAGGVGGAAALLLAAAGIGRIVLAHEGNLRRNDLNRQTLMCEDGIGKPRCETAAARLRAFNPAVEVVAVPENICESNAAALVALCDIIIDAAPLFEERFLLNRESLAQRKPMVEAAMFDMEAQITTFVPGKTPCLQCLVGEKPAWWKREFPVFGAVSSTAGSIAATEAIKVLAGFGKPLTGRLLRLDLGTGESRTYKFHRVPDCPACALGAGAHARPQRTGNSAGASPEEIW